MRAVYMCSCRHVHRLLECVQTRVVLLKRLVEFSDTRRGFAQFQRRCFYADIFTQSSIQQFLRRGFYAEFKRRGFYAEIYTQSFNTAVSTQMFLRRVSTQRFLRRVSTQRFLRSFNTEVSTQSFNAHGVFANSLPLDGFSNRAALQPVWNSKCSSLSTVTTDNASLGTPTVL